MTMSPTEKSKYEGRNPSLLHPSRILIEKEQTDISRAQSTNLSEDSNDYHKQTSFRYRSSHLVAEAKLGSRLVAFADHVFHRSQLSLLDVQKSVYAVLATPSEINAISGSHIPILLTLKYLYSDEPPAFAAVRLVKFQIDLISNHKSSDSKSLLQELGFCFMPDDEVSPTIALNTDFNLATVMNLSLPQTKSFQAIQGSKESHRLNATAKFEYFGRIFTAEWSQIPVSIVASDQASSENFASSASYQQSAFHYNNDKDKKSKSELAITDEDHEQSPPPMYKPEVEPSIQERSNTLPPCYGTQATSEERPPAFDNLIGQAL